MVSPFAYAKDNRVRFQKVRRSNDGNIWLRRGMDHLENLGTQRLRNLPQLCLDTINSIGSFLDALSKLQILKTSRR
jgi:hypothetical protein